MTDRTHLSQFTWLLKARTNLSLIAQTVDLPSDSRTGTIFDVSNKAEVYGPGKSYSIFAGKDGSRGLGLSSLKPEDAVADYSPLDAKDAKVLDDWHAFFS